VNVIGGLERAINVWVDADRLAAYQAADHGRARCGGSAERQHARRQCHRPPEREQTLRTMGRSRSAQSLQRPRHRDARGSPIRVRDIGWAEDGTKEERSARGSTACRR
jgi:HAE1 family hydrophobic/amphiphilic exporter-1